MKVELYRGFKFNLRWFEHLVGQHERNAVDLLEHGEYSISYTHSFTLKTTQLATRYERNAENLLDNGEYSISSIYSFSLKTTKLVAGFDLTDMKGNRFPAKMHIVLSPISGSGDNIKELLDKVDADVRRLSSNDTVVSTLGIVLQLTKTIIDKLSKVRNKCFRRIVSRLILVIRRTQYWTHHGPLFPVFTR